MSRSPAFFQNQPDESFCHRAPRYMNHAAANEGKLVGLPKRRRQLLECHVPSAQLGDDLLEGFVAGRLPSVSTVHYHSNGGPGLPR